MTSTISGIRAGAQTVQRDLITGFSGYGAILADPPWRFELRSDKGKGRSADQHYPTMTLADIARLPVGELAGPDCVLFLWCVDPMLPEAIEVGRGWGFDYRTVGFVWAKYRQPRMGPDTLGDEITDPIPTRFPMGTGYWTRANPELCLLFTRGEPQRVAANVRRLIVEPRREHSRKPDRVRSDIERLVRGPYLELFARSTAPGWDAWGNEAEKFGAAA